MTLRLALPLSLLALTAAGAATVAAAPDPEAGEVSAATPTTSFEGVITEPTGAFEIAAQEEGTSKDNCQNPVCDEYALTVKDAGTQLMIDSVVDDDGFSQTVEIEAPDGSISQTSATNPGTVKAKLKNPKAGAYLIRIYGSDYINDSPSWGYKATVTLTTGSSTTTPAPTATPAPAPAPGGGPAPAPTTPAPAASTTKLTIAKPKVSAKKVRKAKSISVKLTASAPVKNLQIALSTGKASKPKLVGRVAVASLSGAKTVKIRVKGRLKPGSLRISARGSDANGAAVTAQQTAKVKR
jgi:hypothetical protein